MMIVVEFEVFRFCLYMDGWVSRSMCNSTSMRIRACRILMPMSMVIPVTIPTSRNISSCACCGVTHKITLILSILLVFVQSICKKVHGKIYDGDFFRRTCFFLRFFPFNLLWITIIVVVVIIVTIVITIYGIYMVFLMGVLSVGYSFPLLFM